MLHGTRYSAPIVISDKTTLKAIVIKDGVPNSEVATASYVVGAERAAKPQFINVTCSPGSIFFGDVEFDLHSDTSESDIYVSATDQMEFNPTELYNGRYRYRWDPFEDEKIFSAVTRKEEMFDSEPSFMMVIKHGCEIHTD